MYNIMVVKKGKVCCHEKRMLRVIFVLTLHRSILRVNSQLTPKRALNIDPANVVIARRLICERKKQSASRSEHIEHEVEFNESH